MDDERNALETRTNTEISRRQLLRAATGGFALAACGLFLPEGLEETAAREGVLGGAKGGRRGQDRRGLDARHHRTHSDKKDKDKGKGRRRNDAPKDHGFRATALTVVNTKERPITCRFYYQVKTGLDVYAPPTADDERTLDPNESFRYDPDRYRVGVFLKGYFLHPDNVHVYVDVRNLSYWFPVGSATSGENLDPHTANFSHNLIAEQPFAAGGMQQNTDSGIRLKRKDDSDERIEWELDLLLTP